MRRVVLVVLALATLAARADAQGAAARRLYALENDWTRGLVRRDAKIFDRLIAPDWVYSDEQGVIGKTEAIRQMTTGSDTVTEAHNEDMKAHVYGDAAVVTGMLIASGRGARGPFQHRYRFTDTWVRFDGRWRCVASQDYDTAAR